MSKVSLQTITTGYGAIAALNANFAALAAAFDDVLSRDGLAPSSMLANLDMNSNRLINLPVPVSANDAARLADVLNASIGVLPTIQLTALGHTGVVYADGTSTLATDAANFTYDSVGHKLHAALAGNADTATKLATPRNINGVLFDGSADIVVTAAAGTLSGTTLNATVVASSLTSVGTLTALAISGAITMSATASQLVPGATSFSVRNHANNADNLLVADNGNVTVRGTITALGGGASAGTLTAGTACTQNPAALSTKTTQAHGLGVTPTLVYTYMECLTAEQGYSIGDRIFNALDDAGNSNWEAEYDATNVSIMTNATNIIVTNKTTPAGPVAITLADWKIVAVPYKLN